MIPQKMKSCPVFSTNIDLAKCTDIQMDMRQKKKNGSTFFKTYTPLILDGKIVITISKEDAAQLEHDNSAALQLLVTDEDGMPRRSNKVYVEVAELLREGTYGL